jgi:hypothetical protein
MTLRVCAKRPKQVSEDALCLRIIPTAVKIITEEIKLS